MSPPYRVPSMEEVAAIPASGLTHVSTFSGCGGTCLGFRMAGYRTLWANDSDPHAQRTYAANHRGTVLDPRDIREVDPADVLRATGLTIGQLDVLEGSPPCTVFSRAGRRESPRGNPLPRGADTGPRARRRDRQAQAGAENRISRERCVDSGRTGCSGIAHLVRKQRGTFCRASPPIVSSRVRLHGPSGHASARRRREVAASTVRQTR